MPLSPSLAMSLFYLTTFAVVGVYLPYMNLYLQRLGLSGLQIGIVSALGPLSAALAPAAGGILADRSGRRRELVIVSTSLALVAFCFMMVARRFVAITLVLTAWAVLRALALPLVEASAVEISEAGGPPYGRMRAWGSIAFIAASLAAGRLVEAWGERTILAMILALLALNAWSALLMPRDAGRATAAPAGSALRDLLRRPAMLPFLAACLLSQAAHGPYYVFYSIHLRSAGYSPSRIGLLWALAVGCEVIAMLRAPSILKRHGTLPTLALCLILASLRWWICALTTSPWMMAAAQALHAASYAAFHVAAVTHTHRIFGADNRASGQAIYSSVTYGVGNVVGMLLSGLFYDRAPIASLFLGASATSLLGALLMLAAVRGERRAGRGV